MELCSICGQDEEWHRENRPRHSFLREGVDGGLAQLGPKKEKDEQKGKAKAEVRFGLPTDPALRLALVNSGVISLAAIMAAEAELREAANSGKPIYVQGPSPVVEQGPGANPSLGDGGSTSRGSGSTDPA